MCEILFKRYSKDYNNLNFGESEIEDAFDLNDDGVGFVVFDKNSKGWEPTEIERHDFSMYSYADKFPGTSGSGYYGKSGFDETGSYQRSRRYWESDYEEPTNEELDNLEYAEKFDRALAEEVSRDEKAMWDFKEQEEKTSNAVTLFDGKTDKYGITIPTSDINGNERLPYQKAKDNYIDLLMEKQEGLSKGQILIAHFRRATSGFGGTNTQPIISGRYLVIHNGIFDNHTETYLMKDAKTGKETEYINSYADKSDTKVFSTAVNKASKALKLKGADIKKEQEMLIKQLKLAGGWYSVFIYSWITRQLYHFRGGVASFHWAFGKKFGSTKKSRLPNLTIESKNLLIR